LKINESNGIERKYGKKIEKKISAKNREKNFREVIDAHRPIAVENLESDKRIIIVDDDAGQGYSWNVGVDGEGNGG
jgi:hypothetical protein